MMAALSFCFGGKYETEQNTFGIGNTMPVPGSL